MTRTDIVTRVPRANSWAWRTWPSPSATKRRWMRWPRASSAEGVAVIDGPRRTGDGYYECVVRDPEGNRVEIAAGLEDRGHENHMRC